MEKENMDEQFTCNICWDEFCLNLLHKCYNLNCSKYICLSCKYRIENKLKCPLCMVEYNSDMVGYDKDNYIDVFLKGDGWVLAKIIDIVYINIYTFYKVHPIGYRPIHDFYLRDDDVNETFYYQGYRSEPPNILRVAGNIQHIQSCMNNIKQTLEHLDDELKIRTKLPSHHVYIDRKRHFLTEAERKQIIGLSNRFVGFCQQKVRDLNHEIEIESRILKNWYVDRYHKYDEELSVLLDDLRITSLSNSC